MIKSAEGVLKFWFEEATPRQRFAKDKSFDQMIGERFRETYEAAFAERLEEWRKTPEGSLAEVIVLDQFPRNMFRGSPRSFEGDAKALRLAKEAVARGDDLNLEVSRRAFLYMPYMHSENLADHDQALALFSQPGLEDSLKYEKMHRNIIERFGRYPHRNSVLGRSSTPEEITFLETTQSGF